MSDTCPQKHHGEVEEEDMERTLAEFGQSGKREGESEGEGRRRGQRDGKFHGRRSLLSSVS